MILCSSAYLYTTLSRCKEFKIHVVLRRGKFEHITPALINLHWLNQLLQASLRRMLPVASGSALQVAISSSCHDTVAPSLAVGRFLLQARQPGTRCQVISVIHRWVKTLLVDHWRHICLRCIRRVCVMHSMNFFTYLLTMANLLHWLTASNTLDSRHIYMNCYKTTKADTVCVLSLMTCLLLLDPELFHPELLDLRLIPNGTLHHLILVIGTLLHLLNVIWKHPSL